MNCLRMDILNQWTYALHKYVYMHTIIIGTEEKLRKFEASAENNKFTCG